MQQKLDETEEEICSLKKELDAEKALLGETNQKLDETSSALQQSQAKAAKLDSDLAGMHDVVHRMGDEHAKSIQQIHKEKEEQVKKCLQSLTFEREKHEGTAAFQTAVHNKPTVTIDDVAENYSDTAEVPEDDDDNSQEDADDDSQAEENEQSFLEASQRDQPVYSRKSRKQQQPQQKQQKQPKSILRVTSRRQIDESDEEGSGMETAVEKHSACPSRVRIPS